MQAPILDLTQFEATSTDLLDVRECEIAGEGPVVGSVNIPLSELDRASSELPPRSKIIRVAATGKEAVRSIDLLGQLERRAVLEQSFEIGANPGPLRLWQPNAFLLRVVPELTMGLALDLACGVGREAATLSAVGWDVQAIDHLPDALERAERLAARFGRRNRIRWLETDLQRWTPGIQCDLVTTFFFLDRDLIRKVVPTLRPNASFVFETFTPTHREAFGKPRRESFVISASEIAELLQDLEIVHLSEGWRESGRHTVRVLARAALDRDLSEAARAGSV